MGMKVVVKVRFNTIKEKFEKFGDNRYLCYLPYSEDEDSSNLLSVLISRHMGVPAGRVEFAGKDINKNFVFEVM